MSTRSVKKVAKSVGARPKHARASLKQAPGRVKRFLKSTPVRVVLGASALALVVAKLKHLV